MEVLGGATVSVHACVHVTESSIGALLCGWSCWENVDVDLTLVAVIFSHSLAWTDAGCFGVR